MAIIAGAGHRLGVQRELMASERDIEELLLPVLTRSVPAIPSRRRKMREHLALDRPLLRRALSGVVYGTRFTITRSRRASAVYAKISRYWDSTRQEARRRL